jgi:hypothetical protein
MLKTILKKNSDMNRWPGNVTSPLRRKGIGSNPGCFDDRYKESVKRHEKFTKVGGSCHVTPDRFPFKKSCVEFAESKEPNFIERASLGSDAFNSVKREVEYLLKKDTMLQKKIRSISSEDYGYKPSWRLNDRQKAEEAESFGSESSEVKETPLINPEPCENGGWQSQDKDEHENSFCYENPDHQKPTRPSKDK